MSTRPRDISVFDKDVAEAKKFFDSIPRALANSMGPIVDVMLIPYERAMRRELLQHRRSGLLRQSIARKVTLYEIDTAAYGIVGPSLDVKGTYRGRKAWPAKYAHLLNYGTKPHLNKKTDTGERESFLVEPGDWRGSMRKAYYRERKVYRYSGRMHPGAKPFPFRERAYESAKFESIRLGRIALAKAINAVIPPPSPAPSRAAA